MKVTISQAIKTKLPDFSVIAYTMQVDNQTTTAVDELLSDVMAKYHNYCDILEVVNIPKIKVSRDGYKKLGKDPSRYRLATESLFRRVVKGLDLYRLGDIVDLGNILSIETMRSVCVVDADKVEGDIYIRLGTEEDDYYGINRGKINVTKIPVYTDIVGPFGTPTSDTERTAVTPNTSNILVMLICFDKNDIEKDQALLLDLYKKYANASNIVSIAIRGESYDE